MENNQVREAIQRMIGQLPPQRLGEVHDFVEFLLSKEFGVIENHTLADRGIDEEQARSLRARLQTFREDWERPEMGVYDAL